MFSLKKLYPHIYRLHFEKAYDLAMHFIRVQEYCESPKYYRKFFTLVEYMEWYAREHGEGAFTYPKDWSGFNVPSWGLIDLYDSPIEKISDPNTYDEFMGLITRKLRQLEGGKPFYLIGTSSEKLKVDSSEENVLKHEIAHGFYGTLNEYRSGVNTLLAGMSNPELSLARKTLRDMGYHWSVISDEIHAYCATGLCKELHSVISSRSCTPFRKLFRETLAEADRENE